MVKTDPVVQVLQDPIYCCHTEFQSVMIVEIVVSAPL